MFQGERIVANVRYNNATASVGTSTGKTAASASSAPVILKSGQTYFDQTSNQTITGSVGNESVSMAANVSGAKISNVGTVQLAGSVADYCVFSSSSGILLYSRATPNVLVATITPPTNASGTVLAFADGSKATISKASGAAAFHFDSFQMPANSSIGLSSADSRVSVHGSSGTETVFLDTGVSNVSIDSKVEKVVFSASYGAMKAVGASGVVSFSNASGVKVADLALASGHAETVYFSNAKGTLSLDTLGKGAFNLDAVVLSANETFTATNSGICITGGLRSDTTTVILPAGVGNESISAAIGQVKFAGKASDYLYQGSAGSLYVYDKSGHGIAAIQMQNDANGTQLYFSDGSSYSAMSSGSGIKIGTVVVSSSVPAELKSPASVPATTTATSATGTSSSASTSPNFKYSLSLGDFGQYQSAVEKDMAAALNNLGKYISAKGEFNVQVVPTSTTENFIAEASGSIVATPSSLLTTENGAKYSTVFQVESLTGSDLNSGSFDAVVHINTAYISKMNTDPAVAPKANQLDLTTVLMHEIMHALGFEGFIGSSSSAAAKTAFDTFIVMQNGKPYFTGANAEAVYGGPVPLAPASAGPGSAYYHVDVANDLMSKSIGYGQVKAVSALDLAILKDIGVPEVVTVGTHSAAIV